MTDTGNIRRDLLDEIVNRKRMGDKKFHSETSLQHYDEPEEEMRTTIDDEVDKDPGVINTSMNDAPVVELSVRRRTMSQPGPVAGNMLTATAARAARRRPMRNVNYADDKNDTNERLPKNIPGRNDDSGTNTPIDRSTPLPYNGSYKNNGDLKSLNSYRMYIPANDMRIGGSTPRKRSVVTMDALSIRSVETHAPAPTSPEDNKRLTKAYLNIILSSIYAICLVTFGLILYAAEPFVDILEDVSAYYTIVLTSIGFIYHLFLLIDIGRYKSIALQNQKTKGLHEQQIAEYFRRQEEFGPSTPGTPGSETFKPAPLLIPLKHSYCFSHGRHSGSFYLKLGAAGFAMGHLVHSVLLIANQVAYIIDENVNNDVCVSYTQIAQDVFSPLYCFLQLYFVFKYSNVIILRAKGLACYAFMHIIGSSLCFWVATIVRETEVALTIYAYSRYGPDGGADNATESTVAASTLKNRFFDVSSLYNEECVGSTAIMEIISNFSPYLYPFSVEFNILIVAIYYIIWSSIGKCENEDTEDSSSSLGDNNPICQIPSANEDNDFTSNIVIHADCHASNRGMFMGMMLMVLVLGMLIIGFVFSSGSVDFLEIGYTMSDSTKLSLHVAMFIAAIFAYTQTRKLDINEHPISLLDDILLFICIPAFCLETALSLVATITLNNVVKTIDLIIMMIQVVVQTALLVDGLRRCSNRRSLRRKKPGRELLMFLIIANVAMWLFNTFSYKSPESLDERYTYYGKVTWTILGHVSLPLIMFYRFHSSVCFVDMWVSAYKPGSEH